ncbi:MAG: DUF502 domain-containing protein [Filomicrobium sp.]
MNRAFRVFLAGLLAALPLALTIFVLGWSLALINEYLGPGSEFGSFLISLGLGVSATASYVAGLVVIVVAIYLLGMLVESQIGAWIASLFEGLVRRTPLISTVYDLSSRVVSVVGSKDNEANLKNMKPVWCFFGGKPGAAVLALMPTARPVVHDDTNYLGVLIPSAPVPFGGALIYVPESWVEPAPGYVDDLITVYVSMGITPPKADDAKPSPAT